MFFLLKWLAILLVIGGVYYGVDLLMHLEPRKLQTVSHEAFQALETGNTQALTDSMHKKVQEDWLEKKTSFIEKLRLKMNDFLNHLGQ